MCVRRYKDQIFSECKFPQLDQPYDESLKDAVKFILKKFSVQGIIVTGSVINGNPSKTSDLDIFVVNNRFERQRIQKIFNNVPVEMFISPPHVIRQEIEESRDTGKCATANMFSTGFVIYDQNYLVYKLRNKAKEIITRGPSNSTNNLLLNRYRIADTYENAVDIIESDPYTALILINQAIFDAINYKLRTLGKWQPKYKEILTELEKEDKELFELIKTFYDSADFQDRFKIAEKIMDVTIKTHGFFEWESEIEINKE